MVELMPHACVPGAEDGTYLESWTANWSSRAAMRSLRLKSRRKHLFLSQPKNNRWWYRFIFDELVAVHTPGEYWAHYFWRAAGGDLAQFAPPELQRPPDDWRHTGLPEAPYILINPTAAWPSKYWQSASWVEVVKALSTRGVRNWVLTGGGSEAERAHCHDIASRLGTQVTDISGRTSMREYIHALSRARMVLCVDGSASHIAQAMSVPVVTLFGHVFPLRWHWPTPRHRAVSAFDCTQERPPSTAHVTPEVFLQTCESLIADEPGILS
jgi:ADP-heptose:LPS heptosyltransferase